MSLTTITYFGKPLPVNTEPKLPLPIFCSFYSQFRCFAVFVLLCFVLLITISRENVFGSSAPSPAVPDSIPVVCCWCFHCLKRGLERARGVAAKVMMMMSLDVAPTPLARSSPLFPNRTMKTPTGNDWDRVCHCSGFAGYCTCGSALDIGPFELADLSTTLLSHFTDTLALINPTTRIEQKMSINPKDMV